MSQPFIEKNILVIGGTGVGKSSFLNNLALVLRFSTFEDAENGAISFEPPIPVRMEINNVHIVDGQDGNERSDQASSRTVKPQIYRARCGTVVFNFIDTPGMADSEGQKADEEHVKHITTCVGQFKEIHAILNLFKSTDNTLNPNQKYTLNMVLSCLGKTAGKMISFGITHAGHSKDPGRSHDVIQQFFKDLRNNPGIDYSKNNLYCFESSPLFHVLSTKKGAATNARNRQVNAWAYESNVDVLQEFLSMVYQRSDSYQGMNIPALILAKKIQPALASLLPYLDSKDEEIKNELDRLEKECLTKNLEYAQQQCNLKQIRQWREDYKVTKVRVVDKTRMETRQRVVDKKIMEKVWDVEEYTVGGQSGGGLGATGAVGGALAGMGFGGPIGAVLGGLGGLFAGLFGGHKPAKKKLRRVQKEVPKTVKDIQEYKEKVTVPVAEEYEDKEWRDRVAVEEDPVVKDLLRKINDERNKIMDNRAQNSSLYQKFQEEKKMVSSLLCDLTAYLEEHAIVAFDDSGLGSSGNSEIAICIHKLKISGQWKPTSSNIGAAEIIARLTAMQDSQHFGNEIMKILSECKNTEHVQYRVVDIPVAPNSPIIESFAHGR